MFIIEGISAMLKGCYYSLLATASLLSVPAFATILPPNDLHLEDTLLDANLTEKEFNQVIDRAEKIYAPIIDEQHGAQLSINRLWDNSTVNASAQQWGSYWSVNMYGGLARRPEVSLDGFTLVLCHEIGHHLGGYPFSSSWAANEGQSDYFATLSCARLLWSEDVDLNASYRATVPVLPKQLCDSAWELEEDQNLCYRTMAAGKSLADLLAALKDDSVSFDEKDASRVRRTDNSHPAAQCRLDTYISGALCDSVFDPNVIPAKRYGNSADAERETARYTCTRYDAYEVGVRPRCWFKPLL